MIQKRILESIKKLLDKEYKLDMYSADIRLAYALYYAYLTEPTEVLELRPIVFGAYDMFEKKMGNLTRSAYERAVYRALEKAFGQYEDGNDSRVKTFTKILERVEV